MASVRQELLHPGVRLLTLTGAGGSGKTRLAVEVAAGLLDAFADGVFFIDLVPVHDPALVVAAIARQLGLQDAGARPLRERLKRFLSERQVLLVLDNFEHLLPAAEQVAELLVACPRLKVLVTGRAALDLRWEHQFGVPPLPVPDLRQPLAFEELAQSPAIALFVERARAAQPTFRLTSSNASAVAETCVRLDGLPLAIELAAPRVKVLAPGTLLARLQRRLDVLVGGARDEPDRHRTLRAALDWSYDLLTPPEQALFRRLAVFAGGWSLPAAEAVCAGSDLQPGAVFDLVARLVDQSLVLAEEKEHCGELRYRLLETIREYALDRLDQQGETSDIQHQHATYFLAMAEQASTRLHGPEQVPWLDWLEREHDNLRAALAWCLADAARAEMGLRLAVALWEFWWIRGYMDEGQACLQKTLDRGLEAEPRLRAQALNGLGVLAWMRGDYGGSVAFLQESLRLWRETGDQAGQGWVLCQLSWAESDHDRAMAILDEALDRASNGGDAGSRATCASCGEVG